eukprot:GFKZ01014757.1.p1 GENE.GFKZ01014757.1~~GFKZ01014757.1.p1  ORF type:complete len:288 (-),score=29.23 GFKZ01014757.1:779-1546(-)
MLRQSARHFWRALPPPPYVRHLPYPPLHRHPSPCFNLPRQPHPFLNTFSTNTKPTTSPSHPPPRRLSEDLKEYNSRLSTGTTAAFDSHLHPSHSADPFPRIKTTSLSTKRVVISDKAHANAVTLVLLAFRSVADQQLLSWRDAFTSHLGSHAIAWYDVTINESFGAQALSGFVQRMQRGRTDVAEHDYHVAFNCRAREPLERLLPSGNRLFGYVLLLDREGRVRWRASGLASKEGVDVMVRCARELIEEDERARK